MSSVFLGSMLKGDYTYLESADLKKGRNNAYRTEKEKISADEKWNRIFTQLKSKCKEDSNCIINIKKIIRLAQIKETLKLLMFNFDPLYSLDSEDRKVVVENLEILVARLQLIETDPLFQHQFMSATSEEDYKNLFEQYISKKAHIVPSVTVPIDNESGSSDGNKPKVDQQDRV
jgi:hypothetical protein